MSILPPFPDIGEDLDSFFSQLNALLDRVFDLGLMVFVGLLVILALWLVITLAGACRR